MMGSTYEFRYHFVNEILFFRFGNRRRKGWIGDFEKVPATRTIKLNSAENHLSKIGMTSIAAIRAMKRHRTNGHFGYRIG